MSIVICFQTSQVSFIIGNFFIACIHLFYKEVNYGAIKEKKQKTEKNLFAQR